MGTSYFVTSCLWLMAVQPSQNGVYSERKEFAPRVAKIDLFSALDERGYLMIIKDIFCSSA